MHNPKIYKIKAIFLFIVVKILSKILGVQIPAVPSVSAFIKKENKLLFIKLSYYDGYALPGGIIDPLESAEEAIVREISEETGLTVTSQKYLGSIGAISKKIPSISMIYEVTVSGIERPSTEGTLEWLTKEEAFDKLAYETNREALRKFY